jgi:hypothetical protein
MKWPRVFGRVVFAALLTGPPACANAVAGGEYPYTTTVLTGDISTARVRFGDAAQMGVPEHDAAPVFTDIPAYELYYRVVGDENCDDACASRIYHRLSAAGRMDIAVAGEKVVVLGAQVDPDEHQYHICRIRRVHPRLPAANLILCVALK